MLKRFREFDDGPRIEWERTVYAGSLPVTTPDAIAFDGRGAWFGTPAFVLSRIVGRPELRFADAGPCYERIAETMLAIASVPKSRLPAAVRRVREPWAPPDGLRRGALAERAIGRIDELLPSALEQERVMSHGDPHPGNMLWSKGRVAFIDWRSTNLEARTREVVYCRLELAVLLGLREGDRFLETYQAVAGARLEHVPVWDLMQGIQAMRWVRWWVYAYREQGRPDLTVELARRRVNAFVRRALTCSS